MNKYYVMNLDLVDSKKLDEDERYNVQNKLLRVVGIINMLYSDFLVKDFNVSAGDSAQGIFKTLVSTYNAYLLIENLMYPQKIRAGIGYGSLNYMMLNTYVDKDSNIYDGTAFHLARKALEKAKKNKLSIYIETENENDEIVNSLLDDNELIKHTKTREVISTVINLISPQREDKIGVDQDYYDKINPFLVSLKESYKFTKEDLKFNNKTILIESKDEVSNYYDSIDAIVLDKYNYKIDYSIRLFLVSFTGSTDQNISSIIRVGNMEQIRKRTLAKANMLKVLYEKDK